MADIRVLSKPLGKTFDYEGWTVGIKQLTEGDFIELGDLESEFDLRYNQQGQFEAIRRKRNRRRMDRRGVYRTMTSCSLTWGDPDDKQKNGTSVFIAANGSVLKGMNEAEFNEAWDALPMDIADLIVDAYYDVNPSVDPNNLGE